jgi:multidrug/hemolysin transport system permease protein
MKSIVALTKRNLKLFFRNKPLVFFSLLSVMIVVGLYVLFLGDINVANIRNEIGRDIPQIDALVFAWMLPGAISISTMTLALGNMERLVDDAQSETLSDFMVSPVTRIQLILSYVVSTIIIAFLISILMVGVSLVVVWSKGGGWMEPWVLMQVVGIVLLMIISSSLLSLLIASFISSANTYGVVNSITGTFIGFVTGCYMPMGIMPVFVQNLFNALPVSMGASLLRQLYLAPIMDEVFTGAPTSVVSDYRIFQGIDLVMFENVLSPTVMFGAMVLGILGLFALNVWRFKNYHKLDT